MPLDPLDRLIAQKDRPLLVVGNGPSAAKAVYSEIPEDPVIFRMNQFYLEEEYFFGRKIDLLFWAVYYEPMLDGLFRECVESRNYEPLLYAFPRAVFPEPLPTGPAFQGVFFKSFFRPHFDYWEPLMSIPEIRPFLVARPRPTTGLQAIAVGMVLGFKEIHVTGIDFYESKTDRYCYRIPEELKAKLHSNHVAPGYDNSAHNLRKDVEFLELLQRLFPSVKLRAAGPDSKFKDYARLSGQPISLGVGFQGRLEKRTPVSAGQSPKCATRVLTVFDDLGPSALRAGMNKSLNTAKLALAYVGVEQRFLSAKAESSKPYPLWIWNCLQLSWQRTDVLLINSAGPFMRFLPYLRVLVRVARLKRKPVVVYWHEAEWVLNGVRERSPDCFGYMAWLSRQPWCFHLVASGSCGKAVKEILHATIEPKVVYEAISGFGDRPRPGQSSEPTIINVASIQERKGPDLFIETAKLVLEDRPDARFLWVGEGRLFWYFKQVVRREGLEKRIQFWGNLNQPLALLERSHLFFLSSRDDPFPLAVLEAMSIGLDVVAFRSGGVSEALGSPDSLVENFSPREAARLIGEKIEKIESFQPDRGLIERFHSEFSLGPFCLRFRKSIEECISEFGELRR